MTRLQQLLVTCSLLLLGFAAPIAVAQDEDDRGFIAGLLEDALGGPGRIVRIEGFAGALSSRATVERITIADDTGTWLSLTDVEMIWARSALLQGRVEIETLRAAAIELPRLPETQSGTPNPEAQPFSLPELPVSVNIGKISADRITLGAPLLGQEVVLTLDASAQLADGEGSAKVEAERVDGPRGVFSVNTSFENETDILNLDLSLQEDPEGIAATLLSLPDLPSVSLQVSGDGSLNDFAATVSLDTDEIERLAGDITLRDVEDGGRAFNVDIGGDVTALFAPQYRPFFGPDIRLDAAGEQAEDGSLQLDRMQLQTETLRLRGQVSLSPDAWPEKIDIAGAIRREDGAAVLLPISGSETRISNADFDITFDAEQSDKWQGRFIVDRLDREDIRLGRAFLQGQGSITANPGSLGALTAEIRFATQGLEVTDQTLSDAIGGDVQGRIEARYTEDSAVELPVLTLRGPGYALNGSASIEGLDDALRTTFDVGLTSPDVTFLSALIGQPVEGAVAVDLNGSAELGGTFDLTVSGRAQDLALGQAQLDPLLRGETALTIAAARDVSGLRIDQLTLENAQLSLRGQGDLSSDNGQFDYQLRLTEVAQVVPAIRGGLSLDGTVQQQEQTWRVQSTGRGPYQSNFAFQGRIAPDTILTYEFRMPNIAPLVTGFSGPLQLQGRVRDEGGRYITDTALWGPAGTLANLRGTIAPDIAVNLTGSAPLGLASPFIEPRSIRGQLGFDLNATGPELSAVNGTIRVQDATAVSPTEGITIQNIAGQVDLSGGQARVNISGSPPAGGALRLSGPVGLSGSFPASLRVALDGLILQDPELYRTSLDGEIAVDGPLTGGARITGDVAVGATSVSVPTSGIGTITEIPDIDHIGASAPVRMTQARAGLLNRNGGEDGQSTNAGRAFPLNVTIRAPSQIFVRGRGLDAELGGQLQLTGTTANIISAGAFDLIRGRLDILGQRFTLDEGRVSLQGDFDPFLYFVATTDTPQGTASVIIDGRASDPEVRFEASPTVPQDEVLAQILFGRDFGQLSAFQAVQLANAVATLSGRADTGLLSRLREGIGLDDLDIQTDDDGDAAVRAGRYLSDNVYTDVTVGQGGETGVSINIDLTPNITARGTAEADGDTSLGIFFERDY